MSEGRVSIKCNDGGSFVVIILLDHIKNKNNNTRSKHTQRAERGKGRRQLKNEQKRETKSDRNFEQFDMSFLTDERKLFNLHRNNLLEIIFLSSKFCSFNIE